MTERSHIPEADRPYVESWRSFALSRKIPSEQIEALIERYYAQRSADPDDRLRDLQFFAAGHLGLTDDHIGSGLGWRDAVQETGPDVIGVDVTSVPAPLADTDRKRLAEIETDMRQHPGESKYWKDESVRAEYLALVERGGANICSNDDRLPAPAPAGDRFPEETQAITEPATPTGDAGELWNDWSN